MKRNTDPPSVHRSRVARRHVLRGAVSVAAMTPVFASRLARAKGRDVDLAADPKQPGCRPWTQPTDADLLQTIGKDKQELVERALSVIEKDIAPKTLEGVRSGSKLFGAAVLRKSDLSTVLVATNTEAENPLLHGEITAINQFYAMPKSERPPARDCVFLSTHEPCPLCISGITWGGFDNFLYLFSYEDSRDAFAIPHDIEMLDEIFRCPGGTYNEKNKYFRAWSLKALVEGTSGRRRKAFDKQVQRLTQTYSEMSDIYQRAKAAGTGADVPLK